MYYFNFCQLKNVEGDIWVLWETRTRCFKNPLFRLPELYIYMLVSLHRSWMTVEYRLGAVGNRRVEECRRNQRLQHTSQILCPKSCQGKVKIFQEQLSNGSLIDCRACVWDTKTCCSTLPTTTSQVKSAFLNSLNSRIYFSPWYVCTSPSFCLASIIFFLSHYYF